MRTVKLAAVACVLLALVTGCGAGVMSSASATGVSKAAAPTAVMSGRPARFGERRDMGESLVVTVSQPRTFTPGDTSVPRAERGAAFEFAVENQGTRLFRPAQLVVRVATVDGTPVRALVDNAQGYTGAIGSEVLTPGKTTRLTMAFALPADQVELVITVLPSAAAQTPPAEFEGTA
ncbi:hypothetical protein GCM10029964_014150 [Kibdelosporangium lantanae]